MLRQATIIQIIHNPPFDAQPGPVGLQFSPALPYYARHNFHFVAELNYHHFANHHLLDVMIRERRGETKL